MLTKDNPTISLLTPAWNGMPYLKECVDSVLQQNYSDWELIISDDYSSDSSRDYLESLNDPRIRKYYQPKNLGIFENLNFLFKKARASISQILCQDDYFLSCNSLATILEVWGSTSDNVHFICFNPPNSKIYKLQISMVCPEYQSVIQPYQSELFFYLFGNIPGNLSNVSLKTELVEKSGWFNQKYPYVGDFEFWVRAARKSNYSVVKEHVTYIRRHPGAASFNLNLNGEYVGEIVQIWDDLYIRLSTNNVASKFTLKLYGSIIFDSQQRYIAMKSILKGKLIFYSKLKKALKNRKFLFSEPLLWLLLVFTCGAHFWRKSIAYWILNQARTRNTIV